MGDESDEVGERYSFTFDPNYWIKFRKRSGSCDVGIDISPTVGERPLRIAVKPFGQFWRNKRWWSKIEVYPVERDLRVYTRKVPLYGPFDLQLVADHQIGSLRSGIHWKVGTNLFNANAKQKLTYPVYKDKDMNVDMNMDWNAEFSMPNLEGGISGGGSQVDVFTGFCHLDVPEINTKIRFGKGPRKKQQK